MSAPASPTTFAVRSLLLPALALALIVSGVRLLLVANWAGDAPYLDDWNCTGWLHIHSAETSLGIPWAWLVYPQAEHLLVTQRFYSLGVAALNGWQWDVRAELMIGAFAWGTFAALLIAWGARELRGWQLLVWGVAIAIAEAVPHAWENLLWAFQIQFLLLIAFSLLAMRLLTVGSPLSLRWFAGAACAMLACLSQASGLLAAVAAAGVTLVMLIRDSADRTKRAIALVALIALAIGAKLILPPADWVADLRAQGVLQWLHAAVSLLSWPWSGNAWLAILLWLPALLFVLRALFLEREWDRAEGFWFALVAWSIAMIAASAWARGALLIHGPAPSRYGDVLVLGLLANAMIILRWASSPKHAGRFRATTALCWIGFGLAGVIAHADHLDKYGTSASTINSFSRRDFTASRSVQANAVLEYIRTRNPAVLETHPPIYPVTAHLTELIGRLQNAHRWPATLDPDSGRERPMLSRLALSIGNWSWAVLAMGVAFAAWGIAKAPSAPRHP